MIPVTFDGFIINEAGPNDDQSPLPLRAVGKTEQATTPVTNDDITAAALQGVVAHKYTGQPQRAADGGPPLDDVPLPLSQG